MAKSSFFRRFAHGQATGTRISTAIAGSLAGISCSETIRHHEKEKICSLATMLALIRARLERIAAQGPQTHLESDRIIGCRVRGAIVGVARRIIERHQQTVVDISDTYSRHIELVRKDVVARRAEQDPIVCQLDRGAGRDALAARKKTEIRLQIG